MASITILDSQTIDKIAAGEVVERPASVVKELVENAIDANATAITVEIKEGGLSLIRITDNGTGIEQSQVKKAFLRHATSKIKKVEDLFQVTSLGFRGEALSSIASVSQVEVITKTKEELTGVRYTIEGGIEVGLEEVGAPNGTTFIVRNLFYNTPVRRNFLKSVGVEGGHISDLMEHLALSKPDISFSYIMNNKTKFYTTGRGDLQEVIYRIFGRGLASELIPIQVNNDILDVKGYLGRPCINRASRNFENYFVNNRYLKNDMIAKAIEEGYQTYLMQHKFPFCVLHFTIDPRMIDINVHPTKMDIRFTNQPAFHQEIVNAILTTMKQVDLIPQIKFSSKEDGLRSCKEIIPEAKPIEALTTETKLIKISEPEKKKLERTNTKIQTPPQPFEENRIKSNLLAEDSNYSVNFDKMIKLQDNLQKDPLNKVIGLIKDSKSSINEASHANVIKSNEHILVEKLGQLEIFDDKFLTKEAKGLYRVLGQIFNTYWIVAYSDKMFLIDQHAAHEKVHYERLLTKMQTRTVETQNLNPPIIVSLTGKELIAYEEYASFFKTMGFEIEEFGGNEYAIRSVPTELFGCSEKELFEEVIDELTTGNLKGTPKVIEAKIASMSCKAAIKGNTQYTAKEIEFLLEELLTLENPYHCPHGRPTIISMSKYEIEKKFKRIL